MGVERMLKREESSVKYWLEAHLVVRNSSVLNLDQVKKWDGEWNKSPCHRT